MVLKISFVIRKKYGSLNYFIFNFSWKPIRKEKKIHGNVGKMDKINYYNIFNDYVRWSLCGMWEKILDELVLPTQIIPLQLIWCHMFKYLPPFKIFSLSFNIIQLTIKKKGKILKLFTFIKKVWWEWTKHFLLKYNVNHRMTKTWKTDNLGLIMDLSQIVVGNDRRN